MGANPDVEIPLFGEEVRAEVGDAFSPDDIDNMVLMQTAATISICSEHIQPVSSYYVNRLRKYLRLRVVRPAPHGRHVRLPHLQPDS
eukprot:7292141-Pyramimonas_sp.AAC.1